MSAIVLSHTWPLYVIFYATAMQLVGRICAKLQTALDEGDFLRVQIITRFLADLSNASVIEPDAMVALLTSFAKAAAQPGSPGVPFLPSHRPLLPACPMRPCCLCSYVATSMTSWAGVGVGAVFLLARASSLRLVTYYLWDPWDPHTAPFQLVV